MPPWCFYVLADAFVSFSASASATSLVIPNTANVLVYFIWAAVSVAWASLILSIGVKHGILILGGLQVYLISTNKMRR